MQRISALTRSALGVGCDAAGFGGPLFDSQAKGQKVAPQGLTQTRHNALR